MWDTGPLLGLDVRVFSRSFSSSVKKILVITISPVDKVWHATSVRPAVLAPAEVLGLPTPAINPIMGMHVVKFVTSFYLKKLDE